MPRIQTTKKEDKQLDVVTFVNQICQELSDTDNSFDKIQDLIKQAQNSGLFDADTNPLDSIIDENENRILHRAVLGGNEAIINLLIEMGANPYLLNKNKKTPWCLALLNPNDELFKALWNSKQKATTNIQYAILTAASCGKLDEFLMLVNKANQENLFEQDCNWVNSIVDENTGNTLLHYVVKAQNNSVALAVLIELGASPYLLNNENLSAIDISLDQRDLDTVKIMLASKHQLNANNKEMVKKGISIPGIAIQLIEKANEDGLFKNDSELLNSILALAVKSKKKELVACLMSLGADPYWKVEDTMEIGSNHFYPGYTAIYKLALEVSDNDIIKLLLESSKEKIEKVIAKFIFNVAKHKNKEILGYLLNKIEENKLSTKDSKLFHDCILPYEGKCAFHFIVEMGDLELIELAMQHGANPHLDLNHFQFLQIYQTYTENYTTPFGIALLEGNQEVIKQLQKNPQPISEGVVYALLIAVMKNDFEMVQGLLIQAQQAGLFEKKSSLLNFTPFETPSFMLHSAVINADINLIKLLVEYGANPYIKNLANKTALCLAVVRGDEAVLDVLLSSKVVVSADIQYAMATAHVHGRKDFYIKLNTKTKELEGFEMKDNEVTSLAQELQVNDKDQTKKLQFRLRLCSSNATYPISVIDRFITNGANPYKKSENGRTCIALALESTQYAIVKFLLTLKQKATRDIIDAILPAAEKRQSEIITLIIDKTKKDGLFENDKELFESIPAQTKTILLYHLIAMEDLNLVRLAIETGANPHLRCFPSPYTHVTPFEFAISTKSSGEIIAVLQNSSLPLSEGVMDSILKAIEEGYNQTAQFLINKAGKQGLFAVASGDIIRRLLIKASDSKRHEVMQSLLRYGASSDLEYLLTRAIINLDGPEIKILLNAEIKPSKKCIQSVIHTAVIFERLDILNSLLEKIEFYNMSIEPKLKETAYREFDELTQELANAVENNAEEAEIQELITKEANPYHLLYGGYTPLCIAIFKKNMHLFDLMLQLKKTPRESIVFAIHTAVACKNLYAFESLMNLAQEFKLFEKKPILLNLVSNNESRQLTLHIAVEWGEQKVIESLIENGANPYLVDKEKKTALCRAIQKEDTTTIERILALKSKPRSDIKYAIRTAFDCDRQDIADSLIFKAFDNDVYIRVSKLGFFSKDIIETTNKIVIPNKKQIREASKVTDRIFSL